MSINSIDSDAILRQLPDFLERRDGQEIYLTGHRVTLENLCFYYREGFTAEMLREQFPTLPLVQIHKTIVFYLENREAADEYLARCQAARDANFAVRQQFERASPDINELRRRMQIRQQAAGDQTS